MKVSWNKINANCWDGTLFIATNVDATAKVMQCNALCSVISQTFRGAGTSAVRVCWTACYARASRQGSSFVSSRDSALCKRDRGWGGSLAVCGSIVQFVGAFCTYTLQIPKEGPLGTIYVW